LPKTDNRKITIDDVAKALNISKTTVSRAIAGKGRVGEKTRKMVMEYIKENNYRPNPIAKGLAESRTYNIAVVWPADYGYMDLPFFQRCVVGMNKVTSANDMDILICMTRGDDIGELARIVENKKADGVILTRTLVNDPAADYLISMGFPFVTIGSNADDSIISVDNNNFEACRELTAILATQKTKKIALMGGDPNHVITHTRYEGFVAGLKQAGARINEKLISFGVDNERKVSELLHEYIKLGAECVICMDDMQCDMLIRCCRNEGVRIPADLKIASFYDSRLLANSDLPITSLHFDDFAIGQRAAEMILRLINGEDVEKEVIEEYEVILKGSTK
jgi:DNA-binding LacI/PurR family transcriptional regulator